ncbi:glucokinase [Geothrix sp. PMB-07]|uniref:glucokinase n=1 Tax=Geothrix sp. PMB-07 TaxID=3068640 RepID=UPI00274157B5|nr:glucokinase [Geothrix sp. PMB-07]WLT31693.1 glucokinase [Geothrix sp. PMB-07]
MIACADSPVLVADVGGTNLNLALLAPEGDRFRLLHKARFSTQEERTLLDPIRSFLEANTAVRPTQACFSGAGPVLDRRIHLTNAPWDIDGPALERDLHMPVHLVNDFIALSCGVVQLDLTDPSQVTPLPHGDGSLPVADPHGLALVVGAGTGLGVGFIIRTPQGPRAFPSEGGHIGLPVFDEDSLALWKHLQKGLPGPPGAEMAVSGMGLALLFRFLLDSHRAPWTPAASAILALPNTDQPAAISAQAATDAACARAMALFVDLYARVCADLCAVFMPTGGLFLAGGIASKNTSHFLGGRFMARFERNYRAHLDLLTRSTPVFLVHDYDLSLYGAAYAPDCAPNGVP